MPYRDITEKIETLPAFEEKLGISLAALSAFIDDDDMEYISIDVKGEVNSELEIENDFNVNVALYDINNRVIASEETYFSAEDFMGFDTFSISLSSPSNKISKIRVFPKK